RNGLHRTQASLDRERALQQRPEGQLAVTTNTQTGQVIPNVFGMRAIAPVQKYPEEARKADRQQEDATITIKPFAQTAARNEEMARGFVVPESHEARLEEKVDELSRKVEQLAEIVTHRRADTGAVPTWQAWAGSDRPEDVLAKLDAIREEVTGGKRMRENSTDIIRKSREARGQDE
ncbi:MAG: hypothetical protein ACYDAR_14795, partial [Thermomicrobiales bacterium]